ncbi:MAG: FAD-dependent oxidoreductase [Burkholderiales bacterium]
MTKGRLLLAAILVGLIAAFFALDLNQYSSLDYIKSQQALLDARYRENPLLTAGVFFLVYVVVTGTSLPGAALLTLVAGAIFGLLWGTLIVSFASTIGATMAFLASRFLFRDAIQTRFGSRLSAINEGIGREGAFYLFALRLVPVFPFFAVNLLMGLTAMRAGTYYWVSQLGMLAGTLVYVNAGTQLARFDSLQGLVSPALLGSFALLGIFPLVARKVLDVIKARKVYAPWAHLRPQRFERYLVVIGAGSAGLVSAYIAAAVRAKVTLVEKHRMGGDCLNTGCVPSKALVRSARLLAQSRRATDYGFKSMRAEFDFADIMERVQRVVRSVQPHDSVERYAALGVECLQGEARIVTPWEVEVTGANGDTQRITTRTIIVAAGARPFVPPIPGIEAMDCLTSDTVWNLRELPRRLVVLGGGPIGCELAQCFARFGSQVTQVEMLPRLMMREDPDVSGMVLARFRAEGVEVLTDHKAVRFACEDGEKVLYAEHAGHEERIVFDALLCAVGRVANTAGYGLEALGIPVTNSRTVEVNEFMRTRYPNIYACGDVAGPFQFTHTAAHAAWYSAVNALFGHFRSFRVDFSVVPWATFTDPEVARVGLNETDARAGGVAFETTVYSIDDLDRAIADEEAHGMVKVLTAPGSDRILGATIVGSHAGDLIIEFIGAMRHGIGLNKLLGTMHIYPTLVEANKYAAGAWKRAQVTQGQLDWLQAFHEWGRGEAGLRGVAGKLPALLTDRKRAFSQARD